MLTHVIVCLCVHVCSKKNAGKTNIALGKALGLIHCTIGQEASHHKVGKDVVVRWLS